MTRVSLLIYCNSVEDANLHCSRVSGQHNRCGPIKMISIQLLHVLYQPGLQVASKITFFGSNIGTHLKSYTSLQTHASCILPSLLDGFRLCKRWAAKSSPSQAMAWACRLQLLGSQRLEYAPAGWQTPADRILPSVTWHAAPIPLPCIKCMTGKSCICMHSLHP